MVIITAYNRPEFLYLCLQHICKAAGALDRQYVFAFDYGYDHFLREVVKEFPIQYSIIEMSAPINKVMKQSANVLNAWVAAATGAKENEIITLIEDDVFVSDDFFNYVDRVTPDVWASIGSRDVNNNHSLNNELNKYYIEYGTYQSIGVSFTKETILRDIAPHYTVNYLRAPRAYIESKFPNSKIGRFYVEQDGLIRRISEAGNCPIAFPEVPRCFHAGLYGKNRGKYPTGDFYKRLEYIMSIVYDKQELMNHVHDEYFVRDSEPINLNTKYYGTFTKTETV